MSMGKLEKSSYRGVEAPSSLGGSEQPGNGIVFSDIWKTCYAGQAGSLLLWDLGPRG